MTPDPTEAAVRVGMATWTGCGVDCAEQVREAIRAAVAYALGVQTELCDAAVEFVRFVEKNTNGEPLADCGFVLGHTEWERLRDAACGGHVASPAAQTTQPAPQPPTDARGDQAGNVSPEKATTIETGYWAAFTGALPNGERIRQMVWVERGSEWDTAVSKPPSTGDADARSKTWPNGLGGLAA